MIYITPHGGLCNMIRVVLVADKIKKRTGLDVVIYWQYITIKNNYNLPLLWDEIFSNTLLPIVYDIPDNIIDYGNTHQSYDGKPILLDSVNSETLINLSKDNNIIINTYGLIYDDVWEKGVWKNDFYPYDDKLQFNIEYVNISKELVNGKSIGIHIRRGDFITFNVRMLPISFYINAIDKEIRNDSTVTFFLATDDKMIENEIISKFGDRIITYPKPNYDRKSKEFVKTGIVDLLCLSRCCKIYGSPYSSFSDTASIINKKQIIVKGGINEHIRNFGILS